MNKDIIRNALTAHEEQHPEQKGLNDFSVEDLHSLGKPSPSKPISMEAAYLLDGHHDQRKLYSDNFDHLISPTEKEEIDHEVVDLSELSTMLHHPEYIINKADHDSQNQNISKEALLYLLDRYGDENGYQAVMEQMFKPLLSNLLDKVSTEESAIKQILSPAIVQRTHHHPKDHGKNMEMIFTMPVIDGHAKENWKKALPKILQELGGNSRGK